MKIEQVTIVTPGASRHARFDIAFAQGDGSESRTNVCAVYQGASSLSLMALPPLFGWQAWEPQADAAVGKLVAEAMQQAAELQAKWNEDTGRPATEVFVEAAQ